MDLLEAEGTECQREGSCWGDESKAKSLEPRSPKGIPRTGRGFDKTKLLHVEERQAALTASCIASCTIMGTKGIAESKENWQRNIEIVFLVDGSRKGRKTSQGWDISQARTESIVASIIA